MALKVEHSNVAQLSLSFGAGLEAFHSQWASLKHASRRVRYTKSSNVHETSLFVRSYYLLRLWSLAGNDTPSQATSGDFY
jgi:hypothetical protein